ncbi:MAG: hypothetical protein JRE58_06430 [Deltaproteobacteria bacterium]|nr:hypothetical protein [Deltaproteobacteria bacterium]
MFKKIPLPTAPSRSTSSNRPVTSTIVVPFRAQPAKTLVEEWGLSLIEAGRHLDVPASAIAKIFPLPANNKVAVLSSSNFNQSFVFEKISFNFFRYSFSLNITCKPGG